MKIQQIRNATLKIEYGGIKFLLDPWLQDKGTGFSAPAIVPEMMGIKNPLNVLPIQPDEILEGIDYCLVTHVHPDHFTKDYLPKDIKIIVPNAIDQQKVLAEGFENVILFEETKMKIQDITIIKTPAVHGDNEQVAAQMGAVNGYIFTGEKLQLYIAGDTIFYDGITETLKTFRPETIVLNCCEATLPIGRLIMNLSDIESVCKLCPQSTVIATHLDSVNHALLSSDDVRNFAHKNGLKQVVIPHNGEWITR